MTLRELAALTNVSISTVSKAFNDADDVSLETKEMIFAAAKKHGCFGKYYKGKYHKKIIAVICSELRSSFYANYVEKLKSRIERDNGIVLISTDDFQSQKQAELIEYYSSYLKVDGIFVFDLAAVPKKNWEVPVISLLSSKVTETDCVCVDFDTPICQAIEHLKELGHRRIAFIGEPLTRHKQEIFCRMMHQNHLPISQDYLVQSEDRFERAGQDGISKLLALPVPPTAVLCAYDYIAMGAINYLVSSGFKVPEDVSVIGMDNVTSFEYTNRPLTSIDSSPEEICDIAWDLLRRKMENHYYRLNQKIIVSGKLVLRETTSAPFS